MRGRLKILLDESLGTWVYEDLKEKGYNVQSVFIEMRGATMVAYEDGLMRCSKCSLTLDRDVVAVMNLRMRALGLPRKP